MFNYDDVLDIVLEGLEGYDIRSGTDKIVVVSEDYDYVFGVIKHDMIGDSIFVSAEEKLSTKWMQLLFQEKIVIGEMWQLPTEDFYFFCEDSETCLVGGEILFVMEKLITAPGLTETIEEYVLGIKDLVGTPQVWNYIYSGKKGWPELTKLVKRFKKMYGEEICTFSLDPQFRNLGRTSSGKIVFYDLFV